MLFIGMAKGKKLMFIIFNFYQFIGTSGKPIILQSNHFKIPTGPKWCIYKYRVDFEPDESRTHIRKGMLKLHKEKVGPYIFDGTLLYTSSRLPDVNISIFHIAVQRTAFNIFINICENFQKMELITLRQSDNEPVKIIIYLVGDMSPSDSHYIHIFNIIMRKCLEYLKLQLVGREYFDARNKVSKFI